MKQNYIKKKIFSFMINAEIVLVFVELVLVYCEDKKKICIRFSMFSLL